MADNPTTDLILSAEFTDILTQNLLVVPDPQFVFARWAYSALAAQSLKSNDSYNLAMLQLQEGRLPDSGALANTNQAMSSGMGGPLALPGGSFVFPDMIYFVREAAKGPGTTFKLDRPRFIDGLTTLANRRMNPMTKLFTNTQPITRDQVDVTVFEYTGPGDTVTGAPTPISVSLFAQTRAAHDILADVGNQLRRDRYKFLDDVVINYLVAAAESTTGGVTRGGDVASNATFVGAGNEPMSLDLLPKANEQLRSRNVPGLAMDSRYVLVVHPHQMQQLRNDPRYAAQSQFMPAYNILFPGYAATIENFIVCESQRMPTVSNLGAGTNQTGYKALAIAPQALAWACSMDAMVVRDKNDDGGRYAKFGWIAIEGFNAADQTFVQEILTT
jgi:hypothetical protein